MRFYKHPDYPDAIFRMPEEPDDFFRVEAKSPQTGFWIKASDYIQSIIPSPVCKRVNEDGTPWKEFKPRHFVDSEFRRQSIALLDFVTDRHRFFLGMLANAQKYREDFGTTSFEKD